MRYNPYPHENLHSSYDFRRKNIPKGLIIIIGVIIALSLVMAYDVGGIKTTIEEKVSEIKEVSIREETTSINTLASKKLNLEDFNNNPINYVDKNVNIYEEFSGNSCFPPMSDAGSFCYLFRDSEGYSIKILSGRSFKMNKKYKVSGTIIKEDTYSILSLDRELLRTDYFLKE